MTPKDPKMPARPAALSPPSFRGRSPSGASWSPAPAPLPELGGGDLVRRAAALLDRETAAWKRPGAVVPSSSGRPSRLLPGPAFPLPELGAAPLSSALPASSPPFARPGPEGALTSRRATSSPFPGEITVGTPTFPGARCAWVLELANAGPQSLEIILFVTDFLSETGGLIPRYAVVFAPASLVLSPGSTGTANMTLTLPLQTLPGSYAALVRARGLPAYRSIVVCDVA